MRCIVPIVLICTGYENKMVTICSLTFPGCHEQLLGPENVFQVVSWVQQEWVFPDRRELWGHLHSHTGWDSHGGQQHQFKGRRGFLITILPINNRDIECLDPWRVYLCLVGYCCWKWLVQLWAKWQFIGVFCILSWASWYQVQCSYSV